MKKPAFPLKSLIAAMLLCGGAGAQAQITVYTDRNAYLAAVGAYGVDNYDDMFNMLYPTTLTRSAGSLGYTVSAAQGLWPGGAGGDMWLSTNGLADAIVYTNFTPGVVGFGGYFFASNVNGDYVPNGSLEIHTLDGTSQYFRLDNATRSSFFGVVSQTPLTQVSLTSLGNYWPSANDVTIAMPVPEPGAYAMMVLGLGLVAWRRRRA